MRVVILNGSPRKNGNTASLLRPFAQECETLGAQVELLHLYDCRLEPCRGCMTCQDVMDALGCVQKDDLELLYRRVADADVLVLATPIYAWYCTSHMKALMDRLIYAGNKNYGRAKGPALLAGKRVACVTTCGYPIEKGTDLWEQGVMRWCRHGKMKYIGNYCARDRGKENTFMDYEKECAARAFAKTVCTAAGTEEV